MQEPQRFNLLHVIQKNLKLAQKRMYLQRTIYIAKCARDSSLGPQEGRVFNILLESNIRLINEEFPDDVITGFGLFYDGYFINIVEGPEESILKHLETLLETLDQKASNTPDIEKIKILLTVHNMNVRYFTAWNGRVATPPVLLDKIEPTTSVEDSMRHIKNTLMKLYKLLEFLRSKPHNLLKATMDNISELCQSNLPEVMLLEFLLDSPALLDVREYIQSYGTVPDFTAYDEIVWPLPPDFVPYHILQDDCNKKLMESKDEKKIEKDIKEENVKIEESTILKDAQVDDVKAEDANTSTDAQADKADGVKAKNFTEETAEVPQS